MHEAIHKYYLPIYTVKAAQEKESDTPSAPYIKGQCTKIFKIKFLFSYQLFIKFYLYVLTILTIFYSPGR